MARIRGFRDLPHLSEQDKKCLVCWRNVSCPTYRQCTSCRSFKKTNPYLEMETEEAAN